MAIESATYLDDLVTTNPPNTDPVSQGDDVFRLLKTVFKNTFPNATGVWVDLVHTWSAKQTFTGTVEASGTGTTATPVELISTNADANEGPILQRYRNSASPAAGDAGPADLYSMKDSAGNKDIIAAMRVILADHTSASEDGRIEWGVITSGAFAYELALIGSALYPLTDAGLNLGTASLRFGTAYLDDLVLTNALPLGQGGTGQTTGPTAFKVLGDSLTELGTGFNIGSDELIYRDNTDGDYKRVDIADFFADIITASTNGYGTLGGSGPPVYRVMAIRLSDNALGYFTHGS